MKKWLAATGAAALVFLFAWEQVQATRLGFELDGARRGVQEARSRAAYLRLELERRTAPAELALLARDRLGMLPPSPDAVVMLEHAAARPPSPIETVAAEKGQSLRQHFSSAFSPSTDRNARMLTKNADEGTVPFPRIGTHLLSWLLPPEAPRWR